MARGKKKESTLTPEEKLAQALVPDWEQPYKVPVNWCWVKFSSITDVLNGFAFKSQLYTEELQMAGEEKISGEDFVSECLVESDLELLFPNEYIPSSSERMLLYRELDGLELDKDVLDFKARLEDRFGKVPTEGQELLRIVPLRRLAKRLGAEKVVLKAGRMVLYFVSNPDSPFYQSIAFGKVIGYMGTHPRYCNLREQNGR